MDTKQFVAAFGVLAFLGTIAVTVVAILGLTAAKLIGETRLAQYFSRFAGWLFGGRGLAWKIIVVAAPLILGYSVALFGASFTSQESTLAPGSEKYFCEIDCHLAYSISEVKTAPAIATGATAANAQGRFIILTVRTRFDETTISPNRGDVPLMPWPRDITLLDGAGQSYPISESGQHALASMGDAGVSMMQPLRPGESYVSRLVFDVPPSVTNPRLLIASPTNPRWIGAVLIGNEESVGHKKILLALGTSTAQ
jgi:hypothetical protein